MIINYYYSLYYFPREHQFSIDRLLKRADSSETSEDQLVSSEAETQNKDEELARLVHTLNLMKWYDEKFLNGNNRKKIYMLQALLKAQM